MQRWILLAFLVHCRGIDENLDQITLMSYNVMLLPSILVFERDQITRADLLARAKFLRQADILCLQEVFQYEPSEILFDALAHTYRYSTPVLGDDDDRDEWNETWNAPIADHPLKFVSGGVTILSKWPIDYAVQYFYKHSCSAHQFVRTGFVYSRISYGKARRKIHVFGTHLQPNDHRGCYLQGEEKIREQQMNELNDFLLSRKISSDQLIFILGDFNIDKYHRKQYETMLNILNVYPQMLHSASIPYSWDSSYNAMTNTRHESQLLDYIFLHRSSSVGNSSWFNLITDRMASKQWHLLGRNHSFYDRRNIPLLELSDHYPVIGFFGENRHDWSRRPSGVLTSVQIYTAETNLPVTIIDRDLYVGQSASSFLLTNNGTPRRHRCLKSDQFILLIDQNRTDFHLSDEKFLRMKFGREHVNRYLKIIQIDPTTSRCISTNSSFILQTRLSTGFSYIQLHRSRLCACTQHRQEAQRFRLVETSRGRVPFK